MSITKFHLSDIIFPCYDGDMKGPQVKFNTELMVLDIASRGWTSRVAAQKAGISYRVLRYYLSGTYQSVTTTRKLAEAMRYSPKRYVIGAQP